MSENKMRILKNFIENEIANSDDQYALSVAETQAVFENAFKAVTETTGKEIDIEKFNEFLTYYKVMKIVEKVTEELRSERYIEAMKKMRNPKI